MTIYSMMQSNHVILIFMRQKPSCRNRERNEEVKWIRLF